MHVQWHQQGHCYLKVQEAGQSEGYIKEKDKTTQAVKTTLHNYLGKRGGN
jgi:hypothetical protein